MNDILKRNLSALAERYPKAAELIAGSTASPDRRVEELGNGLFLYQYLQDGRWRSLTSRYNPVREAEQQLSGVALDGARFVFFIGEAGFYHVEAALPRLTTDAKLVFLSNRPDYLRVIFASRDLTRVLSDERFVLLVSTDMAVIQQGIHLMVARDQYDIPQFACWAHPVEARLQDEFVAAVWSFLHYVFNAELVNLNTTRYFERWWARNFVSNIPVFLEAQYVQQLEGSWRGKPVVIVGAGPSLNKNIELLRQFRDRALIFCVDTAYRALERHGIAPHLVVTLDGSPMNAELMQGCDYNRFPLFIDAYSHWEIVQNHKGPKLLSYGVDAHEHWWRMILPQEPHTMRLPTGGSVATAAFSIARLVGADPVICVGIDLSYPGGQCYAQGTLHDKRQVDDLRAARDLYEVEDIYGNKVYTTHDYLFYLRWFEREVQVRDRTYVNATEGGALKRGWEILTLREALEKYASAAVPTDEWMKSITSRTPEPQTVRTVHNNLQRSRRQLRAARKYLAAMVASLSSFVASLEHGKSPDQTALERVRKAQRLLRRLPMALAFLDAISFDTVYVDIKLSDAVAKDASDGDEQQKMAANQSIILFSRLLELTDESLDIHDQGIRIFNQTFSRVLKEEARYEPAPCV